jgi:predicted Fe-S protein YdhL (DUF1289 family)
MNSVDCVRHCRAARNIVLACRRVERRAAWIRFTTLAATEILSACAREDVKKASAKYFGGKTARSCSARQEYMRKLKSLQGSWCVKVVGLLSYRLLENDP